MKKIILLAAFFATAFAKNSFAQDSTQQAQLSQLLSHYYQMKDALVAGDAAMASSKGEVFMKTLNDIDSKIISEATSNTLLKDAAAITESKDIKSQREYFSSFSDNMFALAKKLKLTKDPVYQRYCPMKKAYWLSNEKVIRNPYYGDAMLTCGKVTVTLE